MALHNCTVHALAVALQFGLKVEQNAVEFGPTNWDLDDLIWSWRSSAHSVWKQTTINSRPDRYRTKRGVALTEKTLLSRWTEQKTLTYSLPAAASISSQTKPWNLRIVENICNTRAIRNDMRSDTANREKTHTSSTLSTFKDNSVEAAQSQID